jgi:hypothetical protein
MKAIVQDRYGSPEVLQLKEIDTPDVGDKRGARRLAAKPPSLTFEQAAAVPISGYAALQAVRDQGRVRPGQRVVIIGAGGGVGTFAVQLAKAFGAEVTGVCSTTKSELVRSLGADRVIDYSMFVSQTLRAVPAAKSSSRCERVSCHRRIHGHPPESRHPGLRSDARRRALTPQVGADSVGASPTEDRALGVGGSLSVAAAETRPFPGAMKLVPDASDVLAALTRLDAVLERAVAAADAAYGHDAALDPHRGLYVAPAEVARLLAREPGASLLGGVAPGGVAEAGWESFARRLGLDHVDLAILLVALAPEVDLRYERLYAYLQDDVTRKRPTVELVLNLVCEGAGAKLDARGRFSAGAPLVAHGLIRLIPEGTQPDPPLLARVVRLDEDLVELLLGADCLDARIAPFARLERPDGLGPAPVPVTAYAAGRLQLHFQGPAGSGRLDASRRLAAALGSRLLVVDLRRALDADPELEHAPALLFRAALLRDAVVHLSDADVLAASDRGAAARRLESALRRHPGSVVLAGADERLAVELPELVPVSFHMPDAVVRRRLWHEALVREAIELDAADVEALAGRFRLSAGRIALAAAAAARAARVRGREPLSAADVFRAARAQSGAALGALARKIVPRYTWDDLVLPPDRFEQLREVAAVVRHRPLVYDEWGFERRLSLGKGLNVLLAGPSGTGKTMAAEIIAGELGLDLYAIDLAGIVSKYIGETEKNLARIFDAAETSNAILFFDEADALFGKRTEVRDSHDRYANVEVSYLLQRLEEHDGIVILATNLRKNLDEAFVRRLHATVEFPFPDERHRRLIWESIWPREAPRAADLDLASFARRFELAGGSIRNIALAAAFLAAGDGRVVTNEHLSRATRRELQKLGKVVRESDFDG